MANSPQLPFFAQNSTVKAWCHTGAVNSPSMPMFGIPLPTSKWDNANFVDGYNLRLDPSNWIFPGSSSQVLGKALKFSFITPMRDTKYKIFIQASVFYGGDFSNRPAYAHALNSTQFPKLTTSFWIRVGSIISTGSINNAVHAVTFTTSTSANNIRVVVL